MEAARKFIAGEFVSVRELTSAVKEAVNLADKCLEAEARCQMVQKRFEECEKLLCELQAVNKSMESENRHLRRHYAQNCMLADENIRLKAKLYDYMSKGER